MCGRFYVDDEITRELEKICKHIDEKNKRLEIHEKKDIYPTEKALVIVQNMVGKWCKWGYENYDKKILINARAETLTERPMFKKDFANHRCVIPAKGFYEWNQEKEQYNFYIDQQSIFFMAGICDNKPGEERFTIITTAANNVVSKIHSRMPIVLNQEEAFRWMNQKEEALKILQGSYQEVSLEYKYIETIKKKKNDIRKKSQQMEQYELEF